MFIRLILVRRKGFTREIARRASLCWEGELRDKTDIFRPLPNKSILF